MVIFHILHFLNFIVILHDFMKKKMIDFFEIEITVYYRSSYRVSKNVLYRVSEKYLKYQINNETNYNTYNRMFDMCSSYCENSYLYPL